MSVGQWTLTPVLNVRFTAEQIRVSDTLQIRRVSEAERSRWQANDTVRRITDPTELVELTHVIEQTDERVRPSLPYIDEPAEQFFCLWGILELLMHDTYDRVRAPFVEHGVPGLGWPPTVYDQPDALSRKSQRISTPMLVNADDIFGAWRIVSGDGNRNRRVRRALGRAARAVASTFAEDVIIESSIGLECLFSPRSNRNVGNTVAGASIEWRLDREDVYEVASLIEEFERRKREYAVRSAIVHGDEVSPEGLSADAKRLLWLLRHSLRLAFKNGVADLEGDALLQQFCARLPAETVVEKNILRRKRARQSHH
jgi:hypothetical protein